MSARARIRSGSRFKLFAGLTAWLTLVANAAALVTSDYAVQASAITESAPASITLNWLADSTVITTNYTISRRIQGIASWTTLTNLPGNATSFYDTDVQVGGRYEYEIKRSAPGLTGYGYVLVGIDAPLQENRGTMLLLVDSIVADPLTNELFRLQQDLIGDGWQVQRYEFARTAAVTEVKAIIQNAWLDDQQNVRSVFLFGHAPVPYSGNLAPDGHPEHRGAWPSDVYYGEMTSTWADSSLTKTNATDERNWNVPGDGKFDATTIPSDVELEVGRVDFANLPTIPTSEIELLRQYLNKDHAYRQKQFIADNRGYVADFFGTMNGEAFAATGWRGFAALFGAGQQVELEANTWFTTMAEKPALWAYGCGGGTYTTCDSVSKTSDYATNDTGAVFTLMFGSYFGDWDANNNLMRAALATATYTLTCGWSGRPHWWIHTMAQGDTIGAVARLSQNNSSAGPYKPATTGTRQVHISLLGDPSLRLHPVAPPAGLQAAPNADGSISIAWTAAGDEVIGYHVYRATNNLGPFTRVNDDLIKEETYTDASASSDNYTYMVRSVRLEKSGSGTYFNASQGTFVTLNGKTSSNDPVLLHTQPRITNFQIIPRENGTVKLQFNAPAGAACRVEWVGSLSETNWNLLSAITADNSGLVEIEDPLAQQPEARFYRAALTVQ